MTLTVFLVVLGAAVLHALWNAVVKGSTDKLLSMSAVVLGHVIPAAVALCYFPLPKSESIPYLFGGLILHFGYQVCLLSAYRIGDFTQVYPIARGVGPLIVTVVSVLFLNENLNSLELMSIGLIALGIMSLSIVRSGDGLRNPQAALMAIVTGCFIAGYSLVDGVGARISDSPVGFMSLMMLMNGFLFAGYAFGRDRRIFWRIPKEGMLIFLAGGLASYIAYILVVWAFTQAPIPLVTALRETSIVFALLIGVFFFRERLDLIKLVATALSLCGVGLLRFAKFLT